MKPFINSAELAEICGISHRQATQIIKEVQQELKERGCYVVKSRPLIAPTKEIFKKLGVESYESN